MMLSHARGRLALDRCLVMGIVNRTPDSFYDGGRMSLAESVAYAHSLIEAGADLLDLGGVKAGPGTPITEEEEAERLLPLVESLAPETEIPLSVETSRPSIARRALEAGAAIINDVSGLADAGLAKVAGRYRAGLVLMHHGGQLRGRPQTPRYRDVVSSVASTWRVLRDHARLSGVADDSVIADPGLDFGKTTFHSLEIVRRLEELTAHWTVLVAPSRKDIVGETLDLPLEERLEGTLALVAMSVMKGARIVRVHDVAATMRVVRMVEAVTGIRLPAAPVRGLWL